MTSIQPLHLQIKASLLADIEAGQVRPGDRLPSQRDLCRQFGASHMTVRRAIDELIHAGAILSIPGKGLYVAEQSQPAEIGSMVGFAEHMSRLGLDPSTRLLEKRLLQAPIGVAHALQIEVMAPVAYLRRLRLVGGEPMAISECYLPHHLCPGLLDHDLEQGSLFQILINTYGFQLVGSLSTVAACLADPDQAQLLSLTPPVALLFKEQVTYVQTGQAIELSRNYIRGDLYHLQVEEGDVTPRHTTTHLSKSTIHHEETGKK